MAIYHINAPFFMVALAPAQSFTHIVFTSTA